jgi:hypothetical protein
MCDGLEQYDKVAASKVKAQSFQLYEPGGSDNRVVCQQDQSCDGE